MNAIVTGIRPYIDYVGNSQLAFDVVLYGSPLPATQQHQSSLSVPLAANDSANTLAAKINAAVDAEAQKLTATAPGGAVTPTTTFAPSYTKLR